MHKFQANEANRLLLSLPHAEYGRLADQLEMVSLTRGQFLSDFGQAPSYVYFPTDAMLSIWAIVDGNKEFAVGLVGREGLGNSICAFDSQGSHLRTMVQCPGQAMRMKMKDFVVAFNTSEILRQAVMQYASRLTLHIAQNAGCNNFHVADQRLARWLLLIRERLSSNSFFLTHETLGKLLGCRRVGITNAASLLKERKLIDYSRGLITIIDIASLQKAACSCYRALPDGSHFC
jgi:CRP-like cAMP-binding protein